MSRIRTASIGCAVALITSVLMARAHPFGDPGLDAAQAAQASSLEHSSVPSRVRAILVAKCADCHSMQTRMPVYDRVARRLAPVSWLMERDIMEGREHLNLSQWDTYSTDQRQAFEAKIVQETRAHRMPLPQYRMIHWNARVTDADVQTLAEWARGTAALEAGSTTRPLDQGDAARGREVFERRCTGCHTMEQDREGPHLTGVYGRTSGEVAGFEYSAALKKAHMVWDGQSLDQWLTDPDTLVPGNNMGFRVAKAQERLDLIRFLRESAAK